MAYKFPSKEWVEEYGKKLNESAEYKVSGKDWHAGPVALVVMKDESIGLKRDFGIWLDIDGGSCREAKAVSKAEAEKAPFVIYGEYGRWKQVVQAELDPIQGMMQGKLKLKGDLPTIVRFIKAAQDMVKAAEKVPTEFLDE
jgi:putative sterol carrier protein